MFCWYVIFDLFVTLHVKKSKLKKKPIKICYETCEPKFMSIDCALGHILLLTCSKLFCAIF